MAWKRVSLYVLLLGVLAITSYARDRSERQMVYDPATGKLVLNLEVAYEEKALPYDASNAIANDRFFHYFFEQASQRLWQATEGQIVLGRIEIYPVSRSSDPDILLVASCAQTENDPAKKPYMAGLGQDDVENCADANTGGYFGYEWWMESPSGYDNTSGGYSGSRIVLSKATVLKYGPAILLHELGHYVFGLRDEYEGWGWEDQAFFENVASKEDEAFLAEAGNTFFLPFDVDLSAPDAPLHFESGDIITEGASFLQNLMITYGEKDYGEYIMGRLRLKDYSSMWWDVTDESYTPVYLNNGGVPEGLEFSVNAAYDEGSNTNVVPGQVSDEMPYSVFEHRNTPLSKDESSWGTIARLINDWYLPTAYPDDYSTMQITNPEDVNADGYPALQDYTTDYTASIQALTTVLYFSSKTDQVFVLDVSGSMSNTWKDGSTETRLAGAIAALKTFTQKYLELYPSEELSSSFMGVVAFHTESSISEAHKILDWQGMDAVDLMKNLDDGLTQEVASGSTDMIEGMALGASLFPSSSSIHNPREMIVLSDGRHNWRGSSSVREFDYDDPYLDGLDSKNIRIHTVAFGDAVGLENLRGIASKWGGRSFVHLEKETAGQYGSRVADYLIGVNTLLSGLESRPVWVDQAAPTERTVAVDQFTQKVSLNVTWSNDEIIPLFEILPPGSSTWISEQDIVAQGVKFFNGTASATPFNYKSYTIELNDNTSLGEWKIRAVNPSPTSVLVTMSAASIDQGLKYELMLSTNHVNDGESLTATVIPVQKSEIQGVNVNLVLESEYGVTQRLPMNYIGLGRYQVSVLSFDRGGRYKIYAEIVNPDDHTAYYSAQENGPSPTGPRYVPFAFTRNTIVQDVVVEDRAGFVTLNAIRPQTRLEDPNFAQGTRLRLKLINRSNAAWSGLKARYYFNIGEGKGLLPALTLNNAPNATLSIGQVENDLYYVEFDFEGYTLQPNSQTGEAGDGIILHFSNWSAVWDHANDYSTSISERWTENQRINIYDQDYHLIYGDPSIEGDFSSGSLAPVAQVTINNDVFVPGQSYFFSGYAVDSDAPEGQVLTYEWLVNGVSKGFSRNLTFVFPEEGLYTVVFRVTDADDNVTIIEKTIVVAANGTCHNDNSQALSAHVTATLNLPEGETCFKILKSDLSRDWQWQNVMLQLSAVDGHPLEGLQASAQNETPVVLAGWAQQVAAPDPGYSANAYLKIISSQARQIQLNWWLSN